MLKQLLKQASQSAGLQVRKLDSTPWGSDPFEDLRSLDPDLKLLIDVGGNQGQTIRHLRAVYPQAFIHSFEPVPETFKTLQSVAGDDPRIDCVNVALGAERGTAQMSALAGDGQNSLVRTDRDGAPTVTVPVLPLDEYAETSGISAIDLLKIDVEGYEIPVLQGAMGLLKSGAVRFVLAECEFTPRPNEPHGEFFKIADLLLPLGYRIVSFYTGGVDGDGWVWGDVLFMLPDGSRQVTCSPYA